MIWAVLIFSESPSTIQWVGAALVLSGVGFIAISRARRSPIVEPAQP
jgi:drug/metabolite transporter (DMT)-like permease